MLSLRFWIASLSAVLGIALTASLGVWQWGRAQQKLALQAQVQQRQALPPLDNADLLAAAEEGTGAALHRPVLLRGRWLAPHTVFLDNRQMQARPGFYVVTPLQLSGTDTAVLVQRGWAARDFTQRERLPQVQTPGGEVVVAGRMAPPPAKLYEMGEPGRGPIRQNLDLAAFRAETGLPLLEGSVQQTGAASEGLLREWPVPARTADKNYGYAAQWWAMSAVILFLYVWFQFVVPRRQRRTERA